MSQLKTLIKTNLELFHEIEALDTQLRFQLRLEGKELGLPFVSSTIFNNYKSELIVIFIAYQNAEKSLRESADHTLTLMNDYYRADQ